MNYLPFAIFANLFNSVALTIDKFLLTKTIKDPLTYIFYFSLISVLVTLLIPFTKIPTTQVFLLASLSTVIWTVGTYSMFKALQIGQVQRVIPVIGTLTPLFILSFNQVNDPILINEKWAIFLLLFGLILLNLTFLKGQITKKEILLEVFSASSFAISYLLLRETFLRMDFLTVFVWSKPVLIPVGVFIFANRRLRQRVFQFKKETALPKKSLILFAFGQVCAGLSELLLVFSISLANPAVVNSLQGTKYIFLGLFAYILGKKFPEVFTQKTTSFFKFAKIFGIVFIIFGLFLLSPQKDQRDDFGVTFSPRYANQLGLDPRETYTKILTDLKVKKVRLPVYWDEIETFPNTYEFYQMDYYLNSAQEKGVEVILVLGYKVPRWPECFAPPWVKGLMRKDREIKILKLIQSEVEHFKKFPNILAWQVENEPLVEYGVCDRVNSQTFNRLKKEVEIVKSLDSRPVLINDSGELSFWFKTIGLSDEFGTTLYRQVWNKYIGFVEFPLPPAFYTLKDQLVRTFLGKEGSTYIVELQAEPWLPDEKRVDEIPIHEQIAITPLSKMNEYILYAKETKFSPIFIWGVEWWYYMDKMGHPEYLDYAKNLFRTI